MEQRWKTSVFSINAGDFQIVDRHRKGNIHYRRVYRQADGRWTLDVEVLEGDVISFHAQFSSDISWLLSQGISRYSGRPRFVRDQS